MITGKAEVRWTLETWLTGADPAGIPSASDEFTSEPEAREAFDRATRHRSVQRARLVMAVEVEAASHFKSGGR